MKISVNLIKECFQGMDLSLWGEAVEENLRFDHINWLSKYVTDIRAETLYLTDYQTLKRYTEFRQTEFLKGSVFFCVGVPAGDIPEFMKSLSCIAIGEGYDLALIGNKLLDYQEELSNWSKALDKMIYTREKLQKLFDISAPYFDSSMLMWDKSFDVIASISADPIENPILKEIMEKRYFPKDVIENIIRRNLLNVTVGNDTTRQILASETMTRYELQVRHYCKNGFRYYSVAYFKQKSQIHPGEWERLEWFFDHIISYLDRKDVVRDEDYHRSVDVFLRDILSGRINNPLEIDEKAQAFHLKRNARYLCYVLSLEEYGKTKARYLVNYIARVMPTEHVFEYNRNVVFIKNIKTYNCVELGRVSSFEHLLETSKAYCGISTTFDELTQIPTAYKQAEAAIRMGKLMDQEKGYIYFYKKYYFYHMLEIVNNEIDLHMMYNKELDALLEDDKKHNTNNFHLLEVFLKHNLSATDTAAELFVHRNSIIYRLKKLEQVMQLNFEDSDEVQRLRFSILCYKYLEVLNRKEDLK